MRRNLIQEKFDSYRREVIPQDAPLVQVVECRRSFYAGAQALMGIVMNGLSAGPDCEPADERMMMDISSELQDFVRQEIAAGHGNPRKTR